MCKPSEKLRAFASTMAIVVVLALTASGQTQPSPNEQLPPGEVKQKAETACATCHEARIIVQQRLNQAAWTKEVDKMIKWGAVVDPKDREALINYLSSNFPPDKPAYVAPRSAQARPESKKK